MKTYEGYAGNGSNTSMHTRRPDEIQGDLGRIRDEIGDTLRAIERKFSLGELVDWVLRSSKHGSSHLLTGMGRSIGDNPVGFALIGSGLVYMAMARRSAAVHRAHDEYQGVHAGRGPIVTHEPEGEHEVLAGARDKLAGARESVSEAMDEGKEKLHRAREAVERGTDRALELGGELGHRARDQATRAGRKARQVFREQPLLFGLLGIATGTLLGALLPRSRREDELMGPRSDEMKDRVKEMTEEVKTRVGEVREQAREKIEAVREEVSTQLEPVREELQPSPPGISSQAPFAAPPLLPETLTPVVAPVPPGSTGPNPSRRRG